MLTDKHCKNAACPLVSASSFCVPRGAVSKTVSQALPAFCFLTRRYQNGVKQTSFLFSGSCRLQYDGMKTFAPLGSDPRRPQHWQKRIQPPVFEPAPSLK